ncbi:MAG: acyltransferase family protein, partial [Lachnospiraceae bacterium]|nr:acyltransferase family protein [Lachnospiraceae bacterium]
MEAYQRQIGGKVYIIDIIRCIACLMIFFYHCNSLLPGEYKFLTFFGEDMGNDLFFMLSGFSLYPSIESTPPLELPAWYARRVKRILPMLALFYILSFLTGYYSFKSPQQLFTVFIYPTLYWFATGILVFYLLLFLLMKARPKAVRWIFVAALMPIWILRSDRMEGYYLIGFISMVAGCILREFLERRIRLRAEMPGSLSENQFTQSARPHFAGESDANLGYVARYAPQIRSVPPQTGDAHIGQSVFGQAPGKLKLLSGLVLFGMVY